MEGGVILRDGFKAEGEVRLVEATIGGQLDCIKGTFLNAEGTALSADWLKVEGVVGLGDGFRACGQIAFTNSILRSVLYLCDIADDSRIELDLRSAHIGELWDDQASWQKLSKLQLYGLVYDSLSPGAPKDAKSRIEWLELQEGIEYDPQPYEQLASVLKKSGHVVEAREILIAKEKARKAKGTLSYSEKFWYSVIGPLIGYGYRPFYYLVQIAIAVILVGAVLFGLCEDFLVPTGSLPYSTTALSGYLPYPKFVPILYSLDTFIPIVDLHQVKHRLPNALFGHYVGDTFLAIRPSSWLLLWFRFEAAAGWVISIMLVVGVTRFVRS